jgi:uncharacterized membrane protein YsdA (DUF1294 family)
VLLLKAQKRTIDDCLEHNERIHDSKIFVAALLGGALGIYIAMFIMKYRIKSLFFMVAMPVLVAVNAYLIYLAVRTNFGFTAVAAEFLRQSALRIARILRLSI